MKKIIALLLILALVLCAAACGKKEEAPEVPEGQLAGGVSSVDAKEIELPENAKAAFEKAMEGYDGANFTPVAYLGSQVVAGTNYKLLCKEVIVTAEPIAKYSVIKVYEDLSGNAEITDVTELDLTKFGSNNAEFSSEILEGGWMTDYAFGAGLEGDCKDAFEAAAKNYSDVSFEPLAPVGRQVVAGMNYMILCKGTTAGSDPATGLCVVTVYAGVDGTREIISVDAFEY